MDIWLEMPFGRGKPIASHRALRIDKPENIDRQITIEHRKPVPHPTGKRRVKVLPEE
jgi:hypothetical protein